MSIIRVFPGGQAVDTDGGGLLSDTKILNRALNGGSFATANGDIPVGSFGGIQDGDTLLLMSEGETAPGSKTKDGTPRSWLLGDAVTVPDSGADTNDNNTIAIYRDGVRLGGYFVNTYKRQSQANLSQYVKIKPRCTVTGEVIAADPVTTIAYNQPASQAAAHDGEATPYDHAPFAIYKNFASLEWLNFDAPGGGYSAGFALHPAQFKKLHIDDSSFPGQIWMFPDNRSTYAGYFNQDYSDPYMAMVDGLKITNSKAGFFIEGSSGVECKNCYFDFTSGDASPFLNVWFSPWAEVGDTWWDSQVQLSHMMDCSFHDNEILASDGGNDAGFYSWFSPIPAALVISTNSGGVFKNNKVYGNIIDCQDGTSLQGCRINHGLPTWVNPRYETEMRSNSFYENTIKNSTYPLSITARDSYSLSDQLVSNNIFVRDSGSRGGPEIRIDAQTSRGSSVSGVTLAGNDFTASTAPGISAAASVSGGCIILGDGTYGCAVTETGKFPTSTEADNNNVTDWGSANAIAGRDANTLEQPAGSKAGLKDDLGFSLS